MESTELFAFSATRCNIPPEDTAPLTHVKSPLPGITSPLNKRYCVYIQLYITIIDFKFSSQLLTNSLPIFSTSELDSGKDSGDGVLWESSGDLIEAIGSPLLRGMAGLK